MLGLVGWGDIVVLLHWSPERLEVCVCVCTSVTIHVCLCGTGPDPPFTAH